MKEGPSLNLITSKTAEREARIKDGIETLNIRISTINQLGHEAGDAERDYDNTLDESFEILKSCAKRIGVKTIERARPYFKQMKSINKANEKILAFNAAFVKANEHCFQMKSKFRQVEERIFKSIGSQEVDVEGLEMLNEAIKDVMQAVDLKCKYAKKLHECEMSLVLRQNKLTTLQNTLGHDIEKARPYFDLKFEINRKLRHKKEMVENIQNKLRRAKRDYHEAMETVERTSEQIHIERETVKDGSDA